MLYFLLSISFLLNPYLLIIFTTISNFKINKIYFCSLVLFLFVFTNLRTYDNFQFTLTGDDSGDYIIGSKIISSGYSILDILQGNADQGLNHIDRFFALIQLFLSKLVDPEIIPLTFSIIFGILLITTLISIPKFTQNIIQINPKTLGLIVILNPYLIYMNQHLFRQAISLGIYLVFVLPLIMNSYIKEDFKKKEKLLSLKILIMFFICLGIHRGSIIPITALVSLSYAFSTGLYEQVRLFLSKLIIKKKSITILLLLLSLFLVVALFSSKYGSQIINILTKLIAFRSGSSGLRTGLTGLAISSYSLYCLKLYNLRYYFKENLKKFLILFSLFNFSISLIIILIGTPIVRLLFSTNTILLTMTLISFDVNRKLLNIPVFIYSIAVFTNYIFLREGFWGKGNFIFPYLS